MSVTDEEVLAAAEAFGEELANRDSDPASAELESVLAEYTEVISGEIGLDYASICDTGDCC